MLSLRPFAQSDWYGFCGCERFADGSNPLIGEIAVDGIASVVVLDAVGLYIVVTCDSGETLAEVTFPHPYAARAVATLGATVDWTVLRAMAGAADCDGPFPAKGRLHCDACEHGEHYGLTTDELGDPVAA